MQMRNRIYRPGNKEQRTEKTEKRALYAFTHMTHLFSSSSAIFFQLGLYSAETTILPKSHVNSFSRRCSKLKAETTKNKTHFMVKRMQKAVVIAAIFFPLLSIYLPRQKAC